MQGNVSFGPQGSNLQIGFESYEELKLFVEQVIAGPAKQFGYAVKLEKSTEGPESKGNVGVV